MPDPRTLLLESQNRKVPFLVAYDILSKTGSFFARRKQTKKLNKKGAKL